MSFFKKVSKSLGGAVLGAGAGFALGGPAGAVIGAGAGGYLNYVQNEQNAANKKAVDRANAYDLYTWDLANKYNDPSAQMKRLAAAGLNPNLVYGSGNVSGNTTGTAGSNGVASQEVFNAVQKGLPLAQGLANLRNTNSQNELLKYQQEQTQSATDMLKEQIAMQPYLRRRQYYQNLIMLHNLKFGVKNGIPVGHIPDWDTGIGVGLNQFFNSAGKKLPYSNNILKDYQLDFNDGFG